MEGNTWSVFLDMYASNRVEETQVGIGQDASEHRWGCLLRHQPSALRCMKTIKHDEANDGGDGPPSGQLTGCYSIEDHHVYQFFTDKP